MPNFRKLLSEDEAVVGIQSPSEYLYIKIMRFTLTLVNSWPSKELGEAVSSFRSSMMSLFLAILTFTHLIGGILYICLCGNNLTFLEIGYGYITSFMNFVITSRLLTLTFSANYRALAKAFLTQINLFYFRNDSEYAMQTHKRVHYISHIFTVLLATQTLVGVIFFNTIPLYNYISSGYYKDSGPRNLTYETAVYVLYPFHTYSSTKAYILISIFNCVSSSLAAIWFCMFDLFLSLMVFHVWGHFKILFQKLNSFPRPSIYITTDNSNTTCEKYTTKELFKISELLKDCIDYHRLIASFTNKMSDAFGTMLFVYYTFHQVSGCLLLLECSQMTASALIRYLPVTIILNQQLIQLSVIFELIGSTFQLHYVDELAKIAYYSGSDILVRQAGIWRIPWEYRYCVTLPHGQIIDIHVQRDALDYITKMDEGLPTSEKLKHHVYDLPWELMDVENRKTVLIFLMNVQQPIHVKALGIANVGVTSMATILKTSLSYFTFLRSL